MALSVPLPDNYLSRAHQKQGFQAVQRALLTDKCVSFSMPTGTGKTRVLLGLLAKYKRAIIALPNLNLLDQLRRHYLEVLGWKGVFYVCSEPGTDAIDEADFRRFYPAADEADLREIYAREQVLLVTTYASLPKVLQDIPASMPVEALFLDEAHHEEGPVVREALETHSAKYAHKISTSATLLPSHQPCYTYSLSAAIHDNIIKDYELFICLISTLSTAQSKIKFIKDIVAKTGNTHLIVYTTFSEADREGATSVRKLVAELSGDPTVWVAGLTSGHSREQRQATLEAFAAPLEGEQVVKLLVNCRVLGEGADISAANGIVLDKTTTDATQLQQNIGRALRKEDGKIVPPAAILFMIQIDAEELAAVAPGAERNAALVEQVYDTGPGKLAMVAIAALLKQDPAKLRELMGGNQRFAFTRARPDRAVVETTKETVLLTMPDGFDDEEEEDLNGLADAITMGTDWPAAEVQNILRGLTEDSESCYESDGEDSESRAGSSESSEEEQEPFVQRLSDRLSCNVVIYHAEDGIVASEPAGAHDDTLELLKTPTGFDLVVPKEDKDNERYKAKQRSRRSVNFMLEQDLKELVSFSLSDDTDLTHGLTARLEVEVNAKTRAEMKSEQLALFFKAVDENGANALKISARVDEEGQLVASEGWPIGWWFDSQKQKIKDPAKKAATYAMLTQDDPNGIVKAHLEKFLEKQAQPAEWYHNLTDEDKFALFYKAANDINGVKALKQHAHVDEEGQLVAKDEKCWPIGRWFQGQKRNCLKNTAKKYAMLTQNGTNKIVKAYLDKYLADQAIPKFYKKFSNEDFQTLFFKSVEINGFKVLADKARVNSEGQLVPKGSSDYETAWRVECWFNKYKYKQHLKKPLKRDAIFAMLTQNSTNEIVKTHLDKYLDKYLAKMANLKWYDTLKNEDKLALFHKAAELNGVKIFATRARVNEKGQLVASDGWPIRSWLHKKKGFLKDPSKKDAVFAMLTQNGANEIVKAHLDIFLTTKPVKWYDDENKLALFFKAVEINGDKAFASKAQVNEEGQLVASGGWPIGFWFQGQKQNGLKKTAKKYAMLTQDGTNKIVKANLDKFLAEQDQPEKFYEKFSHKQKLDLLLTAVKNISDKALVATARVDEEGRLVAKDADGWDDAWPVGSWFDCQKQKMKDPSKKAEVYDMLTQNGTNEIVKANLDKFLANQDKPEKLSYTLGCEDKFVLFHKAVEINGSKAFSQKAQVNEEGQLVASGGWKIGLWFSHQKESIKDPSKKPAVYAKLTQNGTNKFVKAHLENFLTDQAKPKEWYHNLTEEDKFALLFKAVNMNDTKALVRSAQVDEEGQLVVSGGWLIGQFLTGQKQKMKDPSKKAEVYAMLTQDDPKGIIKAHLEKFLAEQNKKKRKASDVADEDDDDENMEVYEVETAPAAAVAVERPKKRQKTTAAAAPQPAPAPPASRKRSAAALAEPEEEEEQQPKPKRARKQSAAAPAAPKEPLTYDKMSEAEKVKIIERHIAHQQQQPAAGYRTTNPEAKDNINEVLARYVPVVQGKVIFLDHIEFKTAYALLATKLVRPEDMLIPQRDPAHYAEMARHELFGNSVQLGDFNSVLEAFLAGGGVVRSVYGDFCSALQGDGVPFVALLTAHRAQLARGAVVGVTVTRRNPEGVRYAGQDIVTMNAALGRLLRPREPENLFYTAKMPGTDGQPVGRDDPYTYGDGQPMATWLIRTF